MTTLNLKPQWYFRRLANGKCALTSENSHVELSGDYADLLQRLVSGVSSTELTDEEFQKVTEFSNAGYLSTHGDPAAISWEMQGGDFHYARLQLEHCTFLIDDTTDNQVGLDVRSLLLASGMHESLDAPRIVIALASSYTRLGRFNGRSVLPVVCNRMRCTVGPVIFPWGEHLSDAVATNGSYMPEPQYKLAPAFDALQRAWIATCILKFVGMSRLTYATSFVEFNMGTQEVKLWSK
jgi:hypothetical protein